jgi:catechol 2,3-dioxygenase-like lactoylglutathione lyase family enzyme
MPLGMQQLSLLMSYTIFHIGLYTTLSAALIALLGTGRAGGMKTELAFTLGCFVLAGICGGLIASNIPYFDDLNQFSDSWIGPWNFKWLPAWLCMRLEHTFFWLGAFTALFGLFRTFLKPAAQMGSTISVPTKLDHCVIHVTEWERSNAFYTGVLGAELVKRLAGFTYRFSDKQLNVHGPGVKPAEVARVPVAPGNSDLCFEWMGPITDAVAHLGRCGVAIEAGPMQRFGAKGTGTSVYFRDPDGSLMEFMSYEEM